VYADTNVLLVRIRDVRIRGSQRFSYYDDVLERAFREADEPFDLVIYLAEGSNRGKFLHMAPNGRSQVIDVPKTYRDLSLDDRSVILKIHGAVDRSSPDGEDDS
jgi:hypothetical protein